MALTRYVPLPFLDDALRQAAAERMVRRLAGAYQRELTDAEVKALTEDRSGCCAGCVVSLLTWPFRKVLARLLLVWDLNRTLDKASSYFVAGYLLHSVFARGLYNGQAGRVRDAIEEVALQVGTSPVKLVFDSVLGKAGKKLKEAGQVLVRKLKRRPPPEEDEARIAAEVLDEVESEERRALNPTLDRLREGLSTIPANYYASLEQALAQALRRQSEELGKDALF